MPELPEVETVTTGLNFAIKNLIVKKVHVNRYDLRIKVSNEITSVLNNLKVIAVKRRAKFGIIHFENEYSVVFHLGMSGTIHLIRDNFKSSLTNLSFYNSPLLPNKHNHIEIIFDEFRIIYNDPRRFGFFQMIKDNF